MKKIIIFLTLLLLLPITFASPEWIYNAEKLKLHFSTSSEIEIIPTSSNYKINHLTANLTLFPKNTQRQEILDITYSPTPLITDKTVVYRWEKPVEKKLKFSLSSNIITENKIPEIKSKIRFPILNLPEEYKVYTLPSPTVDSNNPNIIRQASEIAAGHDDLFFVVFELAKWVENNIEYTLDSSTEKVSQPASWALLNKKGVCDELTSLFIAMLRSLNIPARYISGVAYTDWRDLNDWGLHAWAEVYFPGYGWVPFDLTYGEFGFIDASHIKLKESIDSNESSIYYSTRGYKINIDTTPLDFDIFLEKILGQIEKPVSTSLRSIKEKIGFGSYNLIELTTQNLNDFYITTEVQLSAPPEVKIIGGNKKQLLLKPKETLKTYWKIKLTQNLNKKFIYTLPLTAYTTRNITSNTKFNSSDDYVTYSASEIEELLSDLQEIQEKKYSSELDLICSLDKDEIYLYENLELSCTIKNIGNILLEDLSICFENDCKTTDLGITQEKIFNFTKKPSKIGIQNLHIKAKNDRISKINDLEYTVLDQPKIMVTELTYPEKIKYNQNYNISFVLNKQSYSDPQNTVITFKYGPFSKVWEIEKLTKDQKFVINIDSEELYATENKFILSINYEDKNKNKYSLEKELTISLEELTFLQRIKLFFNRILSIF